jgi:hypothetical protein
MWGVVSYHYWTETNTNYVISENLLTTPVMQDFHPAVRSNRDTAIRSVWYPRVDVRTDRSAGSPTPYWWLGATIYLVVVWDPTSSFPPVPINEGIADPAVMGHVSLVPEAMTYDSAFDTVVVFRPQQGVLNLEGKRAGLGGDVTPQVIGEIWGFDHYGVLNQSHGAHCVIDLSMTSRVLWSSTVPPP